MILQCDVCTFRMNKFFENPEGNILQTGSGSSTHQLHLRCFHKPHLDTRERYQKVG